MSKECPSCHREVDKVYQCVDCGKMYCFYCGPFVPLVSHLLTPTCPDCVGLFRGRGEQVSRDDPDDSDGSEETDNYSDSSSDYCDSSSDYDSASSYSTSEGSSGGGLVLAVVIGVVLLLVFGSAQRSEPTGPQPYTPPPKQITPQSRPVYMFQNTLPGTYNMGPEGKAKAEREANEAQLAAIVEREKALQQRETALQAEEREAKERVQPSTPQATVPQIPPGYEVPSGYTYSYRPYAPDAVIVCDASGWRCYDLKAGQRPPAQAPPVMGWSFKYDSPRPR